MTDKPFSVFSLEADRDYLLARLINFSGYGFAPRAGYFGQQAIEKYFKALMVQEEKVYLKTHDLVELAKYCSKFDPFFADDKFLNKVKIFVTAGVYVWQDTNIKILDEIVNVLRKKLDFKAIGFSDSLESIAGGNSKDSLAGTWKLPINLRDILISSNDYYND